ncbi:acyltransferase 3 [Stachybotrys elegans]|uniref:Acyltransferase 3 n=1 Tax=Stachybotrys elegans TaxID=80388 RepID=A0A8K0SUX6_9HYPO|nr:acyltransferase 3 [Stachybotrys elegans]
MNRATWLDGLRGIAAAIVATDHYFMGSVLDAGFRSFWSEPPEENRMLIQLPPIRLLFTAHAMVCLFLVISGYAISVNLLRMRHANTAEFLRRVSSAATRRVLRIYLPVFFMAVISQILFFCNLYQWDFGDDVVWGRKPWTAPWFHVEFVFRYMLDNFNILTFQNNGGLNGQLWTMPMEFRGSCIIYLVIVALAFWRPLPRRVALAALIMYWFYFGVWDVMGFLAGLLLAEIHVASESALSESLAPYRGSKAPSIDWATIYTCLCFVFGIWLVCLDDEGVLSPGYQFLEIAESSRWDHSRDIIGRIWKTVGSILLVYAISKSAHLQRPFNSAPVQYLGKISFSLYLVHQSIYHLIRDPIRNALFYMAAREAYSVASASNRPVASAFAWITCYFILSPINIYAAHLYTKHIDERCIQLAKMFDKWVSS